MPLLSARPQTLLCAQTFECVVCTDTLSSCLALCVQPWVPVFTAQLALLMVGSLRSPHSASSFQSLWLVTLKLSCAVTDVATLSTCCFYSSVSLGLSSSLSWCVASLHMLILPLDFSPNHNVFWHNLLWIKLIWNGVYLWQKGKANTHLKWAAAIQF